MSGFHFHVNRLSEFPVALVAPKLYITSQLVSKAVQGARPRETSVPLPVHAQLDYCRCGVGGAELFLQHHPLPRLLLFSGYLRLLDPSSSKPSSISDNNLCGH